MIQRILGSIPNIANVIENNYTYFILHKGALIQMKTVFYPKGVCASQIDLVIENDVIQDVKFTGGCSGNLAAISQLVKGMKTKDAVARIKGIKCGARPTSCPDQLAKAIEEQAD
jgi:uncharacterized protein (TIGR03905 family)